MEKFNEYEVSDFLNDASFIRLIKYNPKNDRDIWQSWLSSKPANAKEYKEAYTYLITVLSAVPVDDDQSGKSSVWANIQISINEKETIRARTKRLQILRYSVAASIFFVVIGVWYSQSKIVIRSSYGQQLSILLPDHSTVQLNANSELSYYRAWHWHSDREVWLKGEALFKVKHLNHNPQQVKEGESFYAHAGQLNIQVLGTTFNIKYRRSSVAVALIKGKIAIRQQGLGSKATIVKPGEAITYQNNQMVKIPIVELTNKPLAWQGRRMVVNGMTVGAIIENYEDTYGDHIVVDQQELLNKRIDGTIPLQNKETTLYMLANILNATVDAQGNTFYLRSK